MLADGSEAYVRSQNPATEDELRGLIKAMVDRRIETGQLNNTDITLKDLKVIIDSFTATLKGTFHARVDYPEESPAGSPPGEADGDVTLVEKRE
jgi:membrane-associated HD superfamily phosphohydrolase